MVTQAPLDNRDTKHIPPKAIRQKMKQEVIEEYLTPEQVAVPLVCSPKTVIRKFEKIPGVIDLGTPEGRFKRRRRILRIPRSVLEKFLAERRVQ
jgi:hypothetical protein